MRTFIQEVSQTGKRASVSPPPAPPSGSSHVESTAVKTPLPSLLARVTAVGAHPSQTPNGKMRHGPERSRRGEVSQSRELPLQPQVRQRRLRVAARGAVGVGGRHALRRVPNSHVAPRGACSHIRATRAQLYVARPRIDCSQLACVSKRMVSNSECLSAECRTGGSSAALPIGV